MIPEVAPYNNWSGDETTTRFDFDFYIENASQLLVEHTDEYGHVTTLQNGVDYTINELGNINGSFITFPKAGSSYGILELHEVISLRLQLPIAQESEYGTSGELDLDSLEYSLDYLTRLIQIHAREVERCVKIQEGSTLTPDELVSNLYSAQTAAQGYANAAQTSATLAGNYASTASEKADIATEKATQTQNLYNSAVSSITSAKTDAINTINSTKTSALQEINTQGQSTLTSISSARTGALNEIDLARTNGITAISAAAATKTAESISTISNAATEIQTSAISAATSAMDTRKDLNIAAVNAAGGEVLDSISTALASGTSAAIESVTSAATEATLAATTTINAAKTEALSDISDAESAAIAAMDTRGQGIINEASGYADIAREYSETAQASAYWGNISGSINSQTDLKGVLDTKGDGLTYEDGLLYLTCGGQIVSEGIQVAGGGGGGGGYATSITLTNLLEDDEIYVASGESVLLRYSYLDSDDLDGTVQYKVNNVVKHTGRIHSGDAVSFDISPYLDEGYNYIQVRVTDLNNASRSLIYVVNTISLNITSTFDSSNAYTSPVTFRYTPTGDVSKTIHFEIDGTELEPDVVETSGRSQSRVLTFSHGVHTLRVWATASLQGVSVSSNILSYEVIYVSGTSTLIASDFNTVNYTEGEIINIPMIVYNPNALITEVNVYMNNELVSTMNVGRTKFTWSRTATEVGNVAIRFEAGNATRTFNIVVAESEMDVDAVTENLELYLTASGRSNNDVNKTSWTSGNVSCTLTGFNYVTNGWLNNALKISGGASVTIPMQIFANDFRTNGKTIEIEFSTSNVLSYNTTLMSCMSGNRGFQITPQTAVFKSEQSQVDVKFKEEEHIRLGFVIEPRSANRLIYTYLNGIISGISQYPDDDDFSQITPVNITLGSAGCDIDIYNIRVYDTALNHYDMLNNYIADMTDLSQKLTVFTANNIHDAYGNILYNKLINQIPIMTITGDLPSAKGDKKKVTVEYENQADSTKNFVMNEVTIDVQGTSSQFYPKKNYKISKLPTAYSLRTDSPAEKVFTLKADYMESSHAHNTGLARLVNECYSTLTPPQEENENIRTTIDGFPIAIFYKANENSTPSYFGVYNFNNDKSSNNVFGFTEGCESWEFANNTSDRCLFKTDDFSNDNEVLTDFEARYPDGNIDYSNLQSLVTWVYDCYQDRATTGIETFKEECEEHFNLDFLLTYYVISEFFGMVDSRAKNMFLNLYTDGLWYPVFYDLDTAIGLNNEGVNDFNFDIETHDTIGTQNVFNGEGSALWYLVEQAYAAELEEKYNELRNSGKLTYNKAMQYLHEDQIAKICEAQYNADADFKYISPLVDDGIATYLYTAQGSRLDHIKWWLYNRFNYMDSKYTASDFKSNYLTMRLYTPSDWQDVQPNASITVTPYADQYTHIKYGSYDIYERSKAGVSTTITPPNITFNDTETILYGASRITSVGDLSPLYAGTIDVSKATKLTQLKIGAGGNYSNTNLKSLTLGNNTMLQELDIRNCPSLTGALDVSGCTNIKKIHATGTGLSSVKLAEAGAITHLELPTTITNLTVKNQNNITNFVCGSSITTLVLENTNLDSLSIFNNNAITKVRLIGVDWTLSDFTVLDAIYNMLGSDENGNNLPHGVISGTIRMTGVKESVANKYKQKFVGLDFVITNPAAEDYICTDFGEIITTNDGKALLYT